jgi:hypothetical protein
MAAAERRIATVIRDHRMQRCTATTSTAPVREEPVMSVVQEATVTGSDRIRR